MIRRWVYDKDGKAHEVKREATERHHFVQPDHAEHGGRAAWREHLKRNGSIEVGAADMRKATETWNAKKADYRARLAKGAEHAKPADHVDVIQERRTEMSPLGREMANRLDGRPVPQRKELIKLVLEQERMLRRR